MKVYISGPITGTNDYMKRFAKVEKELTGQGFSVINPAKVNAQLPEDTSYEEYMKMSLCMIDMCDAIYMMDGWSRSCGANREYGYALATDKILIDSLECNEGERIWDKTEIRDSIMMV